MASVGFAQSDPFLGTWKLNLDKTKIIVGRGPPFNTITLQAEGQNHKVTALGNDGQVTNTQILDGRLKWLRIFEQGVKWNRGLTAGMFCLRIRSEDEEASPPEPHTGL